MKLLKNGENIVNLNMPNNSSELIPESSPDANILMLLIEMKMPFGKYSGTLLYLLPVSYLEWFSRKGFPKGKLGILLQTLYEIKLNGLEYLLHDLKKIQK